MGFTFIEDELFKRSSDGVLSPMKSDVIKSPSSVTFVVASSDSLHPEHADYVCDGTDDQVEIQAAIDALPNGGSIFLLEGTYNIGSTITFNYDYIKFVGTGDSTKFVSTADPTIAFAADINDVHIKDIFLYGSATGVAISASQEEGFFEKLTISNFGTAITIDGHRMTFRDLLITNCANYGIRQNNTYGIDNRFENIFIHGTGFSNKSIEIIADPVSAHSGGVKFTNVYVIGVVGGVYFSHLDSLQITNMIVDRVEDYCFWFSDCIKTQCVNIFGSHAAGAAVSDKGLFIESGRSYQIDNITFLDIHERSIEVKGDGGNVFSNINIRNSGSHACIIDSSNYNTVNRIYVHSDCADGVRIHNSNYCKVVNSDLISTAAYVLRESGTSNYNILTNNVLAAGTITIIGDHTLYTNNHTDLLMDVLAVSATHIRSNEDLSAATPITFTIDTHPDVPRTLSWAFDTHVQITEYDMEVIGVDAKGNTVTETWDETAGWSGETSNAFVIITSIKMTSRTGTGVGDTMDIGITNVLGLSNMINATSDVFKIKKNNANATVAGAQVNMTYDTYDMSVIGLGAADDFTIWYKSNLNIIS